MRYWTHSLLLNILVYHHCQHVWNLNQPCLWESIEAHLLLVLCSVTSIGQSEFINGGKVYTIEIDKHYKLWIPKSKQTKIPRMCFLAQRCINWSHDRHFGDALTSQGGKAWAKMHNCTTKPSVIQAPLLWVPHCQPCYRGCQGSQPHRRKKRRWSCRSKSSWVEGHGKIYLWGAQKFSIYGGGCRD